MIESSGKEKESGMERTNEIYQAYVQILKEELLPAMGCTEPIAIAYAAAKAREAFGGTPGKGTGTGERQYY